MSQSQHMSPEEAQAIAQGPPYPPQGAGFGGQPTISVDVAPASVFIFLYLLSAVTNVIILQRNLSRGHKFLMSGLLVGFSMARVVTCVLRICWAVYPTNVSLAIAANIFVNAGILLVYIINIIFALRIFRAKQPEVGWNFGVRIFFRAVYAFIGIALILLIVMIVYSFFTLNVAIHNYAKWIERAAILYLLCVAVLPLIMVPLAYAPPASPNAQTFGHKSINQKAVILLAGSCLCTLIAGFKAGVNWSPVQPVTNPAWFDSKAAFYVFNFTLEVVILCLYISVRVDKHFHVPDGSSKRKSYERDDAMESDHDSEMPENDLEKVDSSLSRDAA